MNPSEYREHVQEYNDKMDVARNELDILTKKKSHILDQITKDFSAKCPTYWTMFFWTDTLSYYEVGYFTSADLAETSLSNILTSPLISELDIVDGKVVEKSSSNMKIWYIHKHRHSHTVDCSMFLHKNSYTKSIAYGSKDGQDLLTPEYYALEKEIFRKLFDLDLLEQSVKALEECYICYMKKRDVVYTIIEPPKTHYREPKYYCTPPQVPDTGNEIVISMSPSKLSRNALLWMED